SLGRRPHLRPAGAGAVVRPRIRAVGDVRQRRSQGSGARALRLAARRRGSRRGGIVRSTLRRGLRAVRDLLVGNGQPPIMTQIIRRDPRSETFMSAVAYIDYERIPGDVVEFGVFTGLSLAQFAQGHLFDPKGMERRFVGFDSFEGLPAS